MACVHAFAALLLTAALVAGCSDQADELSQSDEAVACNPLSADEQSIALGAIAAIGQAQDGTIFVVDEMDTEEPRVFVSDGEWLVRARVAAWGGNPMDDALEFEATAEDNWTLAIETRDGETRMALDQEAYFEPSFQEVVGAGEELTVLDDSSISGFEVRDLPREIVVEFVARAESGDQIVGV